MKADYPTLRKQYQLHAKATDLDQVYSEFKKVFENEKLPQDLALNLFNLQQIWNRVESVVATSNIDPSLEYSLGDLLGHFYAAESLFIEVLQEKAIYKLKLLHSVKASQELLVDLSAFLAKYEMLTNSTQNNAGHSLEKVISFNKNRSQTAEIAKEILS